MSLLLHRLMAVIGSAMVLLFFSEFYFLNEGPVATVTAAIEEDPLQLAAVLLELVLFYVLFAYILHIALDRFHVRTLTGLFLVGALVGWATEGVYIPIVYEAVPFSLIFPSVSWHALVDVLFGWYIIRRITRLNRVWASAGVFALTGAVWAAWATWYWPDADPAILAPLSPEMFAAFAFVTALLWIAGMALVDRFAVGDFAASRAEISTVLLLTFGFGGLMLVTFLPFSLVLPPLVALVVWVLRRGDAGTQNRLAPLYATRPAWWNYPLALLVPLVAALIYPLFYDAGTGIPTEDATFLLLTAGTVALVAALVRPVITARRSARSV